MEAVVTRRRATLGERSVFEWEDTWLGQYRVVSIDDASVSFERADVSSAHSPVPTYRLSYPEMERLVANGRIKLIEP